MKNSFFLCLTSAVVGGLAAITAIHHFGDHGILKSFASGSNSLTAESPLTNVTLTGNTGTPVALPTGPQDIQDDFSEEDLANISVYENVNRSVVNISTHAVKIGPFLQRIEAEGSGSGWVYDNQGHIVTNHHVILDSDAIDVTTFDGSSFTAKVVGVDPANDVAILKIDIPQDYLRPVALGDSSKLRVGQRIYAIGNPFGLERTMTTGIISSLNRSLPAKTSERTIRNVIQLDAALNQGNSGGPLLDRKSRLVGMNTAIASTTGENTGVGFAIPSDTIRRLVPELIQNGRIIRADMGVETVMMTDEGLLLFELDPEGPAARAGLNGAIRSQLGRIGNTAVRQTFRDINGADILQSIDGQPVKTAGELNEIIDSKKPGQSVEVVILRKGKPTKATVKLVSD